MRRLAAAWPVLVTCVIAHACVARAQDFASASPPVHATPALALLEDAWPTPESGFGVVAMRIDRWGVPELATRAVAVHTSYRAGRMAAGVSQTGDPELGWTTVACAVGGVSRDVGAAVRACVRTDRRAAWGPARAIGPEATAEVGGGAWLRPAPDLEVRVAAPQLVQRGVAPLARALGCEVRWGRESAVWFALRAPRGGDDGERAIGVALTLAPCVVWGELRDAPLRARTGLTFAWRGMTCAVQLDEHPALGERVALALGWARTRAMR